MTEATRENTGGDLDSVPYVGLRPFAAEEQDRFYGRDRDAQILTDKILAGKLTILYAQSGLGKSSLLRALVIPQLEDNHAQVLYFDAWAQEDPARALRTHLVQLAERLGIPDAGRGSPTLAELARLIGSADDRGLVLVLDQFEEFLVTHGQRLDPLRTELGALVRDPGLDVQVVLSLREEFLAALEPFRQVMLQLFQSAYRLEPLGEAGIRDAICRPPEVFGVTAEEALAERLILDLRVQEADKDSDGVAPAVELPMLQLVCSQLWHAAQREGTKDLTLALYERQGGAQRILDDYVRGVMPSGARNQVFTARLMMLLAPPSGLKMSYSVEDLATNTELDAARIAKELGRLSHARILRTREFRAGERFELQHDAFISVVTPWREAVLLRARRRRWVAWIAGTAAALLLLGWGLVAYLYDKEQDELRVSSAEAERDKLAAERDRLQADKRRQAAEVKLRTEREVAAARERSEREAWLTGGLLEELGAMSADERDGQAPGRFDFVASYVLWKKSGRERLEELKNTLQAYEHFLPDTYGLDTTGMRTLASPESKDLTITYSAERKLDVHLFLVTWSQSCQFVASSWGVPIHAKPRLRPRRGLEKGKVIVEMSGLAPVEFDLPLHESQALISFQTSKLPAPAREFFEHFKDQWEPYPGQTTEPWWIVPRWSLPVWHASNKLLTSGSGIAAVLLLQELLDQPTPLLPQPVVEVLLNRVAPLYPQTVSEARAVRGDKLGRDLAAIVRADTALILLPEILDFVAERWEAPSEEIGRMIANNSAFFQLGQPLDDVERVLMPKKLHGARKQPPGGSLPDLSPYKDSEALSEYKESEPHLPVVEPQIRVYVGSALEGLWFDGRNLQGSATAGLERLREELYREYGIWLPAVSFRSPAFDETLKPREVRLEVLTERRDSSPVVELKEGDELEGFLAELRATAISLRGNWVGAEAAQRIKARLPPNMRAWIDKTYCLTDLKILARGVLSPVPEQAGPARSVLGKASSGEAPGDTLRYPHWLLRSLVFWSLAEDPHDAPALVRRLRQLQSARQRATVISGLGDLASREIRSGVLALALDQPDAALAAFKRALQEDREAAIEGFTKIWPHAVVQVMVHDYGRGPAGAAGALSEAAGIDLADLLSRLDPAKHRVELESLRLVRYLRNPPTDERERVRLLHDILRNHGALASWPPAHANTVAQAFLKTFDPLEGDLELLKAASTLMKGAINGLGKDKSYRAFYALVDIAYTSAASNWVCELLEVLVRARPHEASPSLPAALAGLYMNQERPERIELALELAQDYERVVEASDLTGKDRSRKLELAHWLQARAHFGLAHEGREDHWKPAETLLRKLLGSGADAVALDAHTNLAKLLRERERSAEFLRLNETVKARWPKDVNAIAADLMVRFGQGDAKGVLAVARVAEAKYEKPLSGFLFTASLGQLLVQPEGWEATVERFLDETDHPYRDYVSLIYRAQAQGATAVRAQRRLEKRWKQIDPSRWKDRMREGDATAWREMLIGRAVAPEEEETRIPILEDEAAWKKSELAGLPMSRLGQRCEFWFYEAMRLKALDDDAGMRECLRRCVKLGFVKYLEHWMARFLLSEKR